LAAPARDDAAIDAALSEGPSRRCLVSGEVRPKKALLRCVVDPGGKLVPDIAGKLPGRGLWLTARRDIVAMAVAKRLFARAAKAPVIVEAGLEDRVEAQLAARCRDLLGLARRAGQGVAGFVKVKAALGAGEAAVLVAAIDGAADGRDKLAGLAPGLPLVACLTGTELGQAFGREHVVHAALRPGRLAEAFVGEAKRLAGFRAGATVKDETDLSDGTGLR
jgi:predicted RNA-binding protein YlxR (DUF448 family)